MRFPPASGPSATPPRSVDDTILRGQQHVGRLGQALPAGRRARRRSARARSAGGRRAASRRAPSGAWKVTTPVRRVTALRIAVMSEYPMSGFGAWASASKSMPIEDPGRAVAAPDAPDRIDVGIAQGGVQIGQPLLVGAGEVAMALPRCWGPMPVRNPAHGRAPRRALNHLVPATVPRARPARRGCRARVGVVESRF